MIINKQLLLQNSMFITAFSKQKNDKKKDDIHCKDTHQKITNLLELSCHICASSYDTMEKIPIIICPQQHTYCLICVNQLFNHRSNAQRCPSCRVFVTKNATYTNKTLLRLIDLVPNLAAQYAKLINDNQKLAEEIRNVEKECGKLKNPDGCQKQNMENKEIKKIQIKMEDLQNHFPQVIDVNGSKKYSKLDIKGFLARKRLSNNKQNKKYLKNQLTERQKIKSVKP